MWRKITLLSLFVFSEVDAGPHEHAQKLQQQGQRTAQTTNPNVIPDFKTDSPPETALNDHHALEAAIPHAGSKSEAADFIRHSAETRPYFRLDLDNDPLIANSQASVDTPQAVLAKPLENRELHAEFKFFTCEESKPKTELKCSKNLLPPVFDVQPAKYANFWCSAGNHRPDDPHCSAKTYYNPARMYEPEKINIKKELWTSTCGVLEEKERLSLCRLIKKECPGGKETRDVVGTMGDKTVTRAITRDCWRYELTYSWAHSGENTCESFRKDGCEQIKSDCLTKIAGTCVTWTQTFRCFSRGKESKRKVCGSPYTLSDDSLSAQEAPNNDMAEAIAKLQVLQEVQGELRAGGDAAAFPLIFKGESRACTIAFAGFKNCCRNGKGWGVSLGISGCDGEEMDLAERQRRGLCHEIGTYCAKKVLKICVRKKRRSCCFPSKLSRILHEQGRSQIGLGWGSPEHPECRGFSIEELTRINFDHLDLSEIFADVAARMKQKTTDAVQRNLSDRIGQMTHTFKNKPTGGEM
ncbi:MAG TPA: conjugal transfer protein TraN [Alphaproteobacteria bacterium]|nr:conjugal transfer protein TraN [Alphaproteobacteria bacterium]HQS93763.1 conjugal transfer protein TraN [Alphaproteobacteria bacterium]